MVKSKEYKFNAILLAAGLGTRLRPLTEILPKPLIPVKDRPLIGNIISNLKRAGAGSIAINTHHLHEKLVDFVIEADLAEIRLYHEPEILGTGGPLINAKELLCENDYFMLHNGDILTDVDLSAIIEHHVSSGKDVTMMMIDGSENKVNVSTDGTILDILDVIGDCEDGDRKYTYAGISVFSERIFDYMPDEPENYSIIKAILDMMRDTKGAVNAFIPEDIYWNDLGTVKHYFRAIDDSYDGTFNMQEADFQGYHSKSLLEQGSDRRFFRITTPGATRILMQSSENDADFDRFLDYGRFFNEIGLNTPELYGHNEDNYSVLMEDLGNTTLYKTVAESKDSLLETYRIIIDSMIQFHLTATTALETAEDAPEFRIFDYDYLRWETTYFKDNFLEKHCGIARSKIDSLDGEFDRLAKDVFNQPRVVIHRDLQSQNIMFKDGQVHFVDYQGSRLGPVGYDVMSLLCDPYVDLSGYEYSELFDYYLSCREMYNFEADLNSFRDYCLKAGLQRIMQALGAFTFLSHTKGKKQYLGYIAPAYKKLNELLAETNDFELLKKTLSRCPIN